MQHREHCVAFKNNKGQTLRGIFHLSSAENRKNVTLVSLNTGLNDMVGWHRLQVKAARYLTDRGYDVLRYDDAGIGDSDGDIESESIVEIFASIETGLFLENAEAAVNFSEQEIPGNKQVYLGFCGGGVTALLSAAENTKVSGVICIGGPVTISSNEYLHKQDPWVVDKNVTNYKNKLTDWRAWLRLLTFRGDYKTIFMSVWKYAEHKIKGAYSNQVDLSKLEGIKNLNLSFFRSFEKIVKRACPCLFFYADTDSATWEFKKYFYPAFEKKYFSKNSNYKFIEAENANHILSGIESQELLYSEVTGWLEKNL